MSNSEFERCGFKGHRSELCWVFQASAGISSGPSDIQDTVGRCIRCDVFNEALERATGRRESDRLLTLTLKRLIGQLVDYNMELTSTTGSLQKRIEELAVLKSVSEALLQTEDLYKALAIVLTGVTSGEAFGFNRAMIFLVDSTRNVLEGQLGLGHLEYREAPKIWNNLRENRLTFENLIDKILDMDDIPVNNLSRAIKEIVLPLAPDRGVLTQAILERRPLSISTEAEVELGDSRLEPILGRIPFAVIPIISRYNVLGVITVDNSITCEKITEEDIRTLETLANQAAAKIENALLHRTLELKYAELKHVHSLLKKNQEYLVESERLAELGRFATTIAHEIKTPLITIGGYAQRVLRKLDREEKVERRLVQIISDEILRLERIAVEVLDLSRKSPLQLVAHDLNEIVSETLEVQERKLRYQDIVIEKEFYPKELEVLSDKDRLKQVFFNLIQNSAEAMSEGGKMKLSTGRNGDYIYLRISDTGCGMDDQAKSKLFTPFFTSKRTGTGLGLPVSKKIIDDHGGSILVESKLDRGTSFIVNLPARANPSERRA
jgi:hypothetical protein